RPGQSARDAPLEKTAIGRPVGAPAVRAAAAKNRLLPFFRGSALRFGGQRRDTAVRRIDDERGAPGRHFGAAVPPEFVIGAADVSLRALAVPLVGAAIHHSALECGGLLVAQLRLPGKLRGPLERCNCLVLV